MTQFTVGAPNKQRIVHLLAYHTLVRWLKASRDAMQESLGDLLLHSKRIDASRTCMVGDRLDTDIAFGRTTVRAFPWAHTWHMLLVVPLVFMEIHPLTPQQCMW